MARVSSGIRYNGYGFTKLWPIDGCNDNTLLLRNPYLMLIPLFSLCTDKQAAGLEAKEISGHVVIITFGSIGLGSPEDTPG